jgi:hypothetical protein
MADKSSNTGTGGINIGGKLYIYDTGLPDGEGGARGTWSPGDVAVDNTKKDLTKPTRIKLGQYLSRTTLGLEGASTIPNVYPVGAGDSTKIVEGSLLDATGYPAHPSPSTNEANFSSDFSSHIGAPAPLPLRRGLSSPQVGVPDGNELLPSAADAAPAGPPYVKFTSLKGPVVAYTQSEFDKNLTTPLSPAVVVGDGGSIGATGIRSLHISRTKGSSDGVFTDPSTAIDLSGEVAQLTTEMSPVLSKIDFKIDPFTNPLAAPTKLKYGDPDSVTDSQKNPKNSSYFTLGKFFQDSYTAAFAAASSANLANPLSIKRGLVGSTGVDGNALLSSAAAEAPAGPSYVKFTSLKDPMSTYLAAVLKSNENNALDPARYSILDGKTVSLRVPVVGDSSGTSKKILDGTPANDLPLLSAAARLTSISYLDPAGNNPVNVYPVDPITNNLKLFSFEFNNRPLSTTSIQNNPSNNSYFSKLNSTYSQNFATAQGNKFNFRRGRVSGDKSIPDGNRLLKSYVSEAGASDKYIKFVQGFNFTNIEFSRAGHEKNLYNTFLPPQLFNFEDSSTIRDLHIPTNFAEDSGTSQHVMNPADVSRTWDQLRSATEAHVVSSNNAYPIGVPRKQQVGQSIVLSAVGFTDNKGYPVSPFLDSSNNDGKFFTFGISKDITSTKTIALATAASAKFDPFVLRRGMNRGAVPLPGYDGNTLLLDSAPIQQAGGGFIKFTKLNAPVETYFKAATGGNIHNAASPASPNFKTSNDDISSDPLIVLRTNDDIGTSKNVLNPPKINIEDLAAAANEAHLKTASQPNANAYYVIDSYAPQSIVPITDKNGIPASPSAAQSNPANSSYFSKLDPLSTYSPAVTKLEIKRGKSLSPGDDGNKLLPGAASGKNLNKNIRSYTQTVLDPNRYSPLDSKPEPLIDLENPAGDTRKWVPSSGLNPSEDGGSSKKILNPSLGEKLEGSYTKAHDVTTAGKNKYPLDADLPPEKTTKLTDASGAPMPLKVENSQNFTNNKSDIWTKWTQQSAGSIFIKKGKSSSGTVDGNDLLDANNGATDGGVTSYVDSLLSTNTLQPYSTKNLTRSNKKDLEAQSTAVFTRFTSPRSMRFGQRVEANEERKYNFNRLAQVGTALQIRAAGEVPSINDDFNPTNSATAALSSLLPGLGQLDIPRNVSILDIENVIDNLTEKEIREEQLQNPNSLFQGTVNHIYEKFAAFSAVASIALTAALVVVAGLAIELSATLLGFNKASEIEGRNVAYQAGVSGDYGIPSADNFYHGRKGIGNFNGGSMTSSADDIISIFLPGPGNSSFILRFFGLAPTKNKLKTATLAGLEQFFGVTGGSPPRVIQSVGYYTIMARALVRSLVQLAYDFKDLAEALLANPFAGILEIFEIFGKIKKSRFIASINIFAQIGDASLSAGLDAEGNSVDTTIVGLDAGNKISTIDAQPNDIASAAYRKNRVGFLKSDTKLAWATNRTYDLFMIPGLVAANSALGGGRLLTDDPYQHTRFELLESTDSTSRISDDLREEYENAFESEYVPFYFQDVRTNEITGFHAFLTSLQDDYSANYESMDGFGRVESVKTYKNTTRRISFSFMVAALDTKDFDSMWLKINKLTTLVYPQYTAGKFITTKDADGKSYTFAKPFSQQIGASPLVRIRLGNLFRSNYSKFNIAGIFGFNDPNAVVADTPNTNKTIKDLEALKDQKKLYAPGNKFSIRGGTVQVDGFKLDLNQLSNAAWLQIVDNKDVKNFGTVIAKIVKNDSANGSIAGLSLLAQQALADEQEVALLTSDIGDPTEETKKKLTATNVSNMSDLLNEDKNAITRSFKSAGGRGLAGFIDSMSFDWYDRTTWDTDLGRKAPKMCKVTISFSPIHDISPGLDSSGYNRAPIYPIGPHALSK